jgi:hypothetical protein
MLEDIAPAVDAAQKIRLVNSGTGNGNAGLPFQSHISFRPFISYLKSNAGGGTDTRSRFYNYLVEKFEAEPELLEPVADSSRLDNYGALLELLGTSLFPIVTEPQKNIYTLAVPYQFSVFNNSSGFRKLFVKENEQFLLPENMSAEELKEIHSSLIYEHVLEKFYGVKLNANTDLIYPVIDEETGMKRYYRLRYDRRFIDLQLRGELPPIQDCAVCLNTFRILDLDHQLKKMPLDLFSAEGFGIWIAEDVTMQESLDEIKQILLRQESCDTGVINDLKNCIHGLVGLNNLQIGLSPFIKLNGEFVLDDACTRHSLLGKNWRNNDEKSQQMFHYFLGFLSQRPEPMPIAVLDEPMTQMAPFLRDIYDEGMRSYLIYAVQNNDGFLGLLELASPVSNQLNLDVMARLEPAMPLISLAFLKNRESFNHRIERLIKEKFTALQPSVEWKFAKVAWENMRGNEEGLANALTKSVAFDSVYPLYGAIDIRNTSLERMATIQKDIKAHLELVNDVLDKMQVNMPLPLLEGLRFKSEGFREVIEKNIQAEDEVKINEFLTNELEPVLVHLQKNNLAAKEIIDSYLQLAHDNESYLYRYRGEFEKSLAAINEAVLHYLDREENALQQSYPHYFEKYRTDGVEYTIYMGQSIAPNNPFDVLYLKNIRLWQLKSMAEIARITHQLVPSLPVPLRTTQLLLIHSQPISISFRRDERRFDVEGSYNIRYEIMKKRLDKVRLKDTTERLTQPGKIAMVYSNPKEAQEYQEYVQFLQSKKILHPGLEMLDLEELQGVSGLKALRVDINLEG